MFRRMWLAGHDTNTLKIPSHTSSHSFSQKVTHIPVLTFETSLEFEWMFTFGHTQVFLFLKYCTWLMRNILFKARSRPQILLVSPMKTIVRVLSPSKDKVATPTTSCYSRDDSTACDCSTSAQTASHRAGEHWVSSGKTETSASCYLGNEGTKSGGTMAKTHGIYCTHVVSLFYMREGTMSRVKWP